MRGEDILVELENLIEEWEEGLTIPSPPRRAGSANRSRSDAFGGALPVQAGMRLDDVFQSLQQVVNVQSSS